MRRLLTPRWLLGHALVWLAVAVFGVLGWWQAGRAAEGNTLSWAYTFEWPLFAICLIVLWIREMRSVVRQEPPPVSPQKRRPVITRREAVDDVEPAELAAYNDYLAWLNANPDARPVDYPGGSTATVTSPAKEHSS